MFNDIPRVLVVDDDSDMRKMACDYLTPKGCLVSQAVDGAKAMMQIADNPPDVILLDIGLPDVSGTDLLADIQAQCPDVAVIFITALNEGELAAKMVRRGAVHYLVKPIQMSRLWATVQEAWAARRTRLGDMDTLHALTPREREVLALLAEGKKDSEIAEVLGVSVRTISNHISNILSEIGVESRVQAAIKWHQYTSAAKNG